VVVAVVVVGDVAVGCGDRARGTVVEVVVVAVVRMCRGVGAYRDATLVVTRSSHLDGAAPHSRVPALAPASPLVRVCGPLL
jgi:hypothetical protein